MGDEVIKQFGMPDRRQRGEVEPLGSVGKDFVTTSAKFMCGTLVASRGGRAAGLVAAELCGQGAGFLYGQVAPVVRQGFWFRGQSPVPPPPRQTPPPPVSQPPAPPPPRQPPTPPVSQPPTPPVGQPPTLPEGQGSIPPPPRQLYGHYDRDQGSWLADSFEGALRFAEFVASGGQTAGKGFVEGDGDLGVPQDQVKPPKGIPSPLKVTDRILKSVLPNELNVHWLARRLGAELQKFLGLGQTKIDRQKENIQDFYTVMFKFFDSVLPSFQVNDNHALQFKSKGVKRELGQRPEIAALAPLFSADASLLAKVGIGYDKSGPGVEQRIVNQFLANAANSGWTVDQTKAYWQAIVLGAKEARK